MNKKFFEFKKYRDDEKARRQDRDVYVHVMWLNEATLRHHLLYTVSDISPFYSSSTYSTEDIDILHKHTCRWLISLLDNFLLIRLMML